MYSQCIMYTCVCLTQSVSVILMVFESETVCLFLPKPCTVNKTVCGIVFVFTEMALCTIQSVIHSFI